MATEGETYVRYETGAKRGDDFMHGLTVFAQRLSAIASNLTSNEQSGQFCLLDPSTLLFRFREGEAAVCFILFFGGDVITPDDIPDKARWFKIGYD